MKLFLCLTDTDHAKGGPQKPIASTGKTKGSEIYNEVYRQWRQTIAFGKGQTWPKEEKEVGEEEGRTSAKQYQSRRKGCCP